MINFLNLTNTAKASPQLFPDLSSNPAQTVSVEGGSGQAFMALPYTLDGLGKQLVNQVEHGLKSGNSEFSAAKPAEEFAVEGTDFPGKLNLFGSGKHLALAASSGNKIFSAGAEISTKKKSGTFVHTRPTTPVVSGKTPDDTSLAESKVRLLPASGQHLKLSLAVRKTAQTEASASGMKSPVLAEEILPKQPKLQVAPSALQIQEMAPATKRIRSGYLGLSVIQTVAASAASAASDVPSASDAHSTQPNASATSKPGSLDPTLKSDGQVKSRHPLGIHIAPMPPAVVPVNAGQVFSLNGRVNDGAVQAATISQPKSAARLHLAPPRLPWKMVQSQTTQPQSGGVALPDTAEVVNIPVHNQVSQVASISKKTARIGIPSLPGLRLSTSTSLKRGDASDPRPLAQGVTGSVRVANRRQAVLTQLVTESGAKEQEPASQAELSMQVTGETRKHPGPAAPFRKTTPSAPIKPAAPSPAHGLQQPSSTPIETGEKVNLSDNASVSVAKATVSRILPTSAENEHKLTVFQETLDPAKKPTAQVAPGAVRSVRAGAISAGAISAGASSAVANPLPEEANVQKNGAGRSVYITHNGDASSSSRSGKTPADYSHEWKPVSDKNPAETTLPKGIAHAREAEKVEAFQQDVIAGQPQKAPKGMAFTNRILPTGKGVEAKITEYKTTFPVKTEADQHSPSSHIKSVSLNAGVSKSVAHVAPGKTPQQPLSTIVNKTDMGLSTEPSVQASDLPEPAELVAGKKQLPGLSNERKSDSPKPAPLSSSVNPERPVSGKTNLAPEIIATEDASADEPVSVAPVKPEAANRPSTVETKLVSSPASAIQVGKESKTPPVPASQILPEQGHKSTSRSTKVTTVVTANNPNSAATAERTHGSVPPQNENPKTKQASSDEPALVMDETVNAETAPAVARQQDSKPVAMGKMISQPTSKSEPTVSRVAEPLSPLDKKEHVTQPSTVDPRTPEEAVSIGPRQHRAIQVAWRSPLKSLELRASSWQAQRPQVIKSSHGLGPLPLPAKLSRASQNIHQLAQGVASIAEAAGFKPGKTAGTDRKPVTSVDSGSVTKSLPSIAEGAEPGIVTAPAIAETDRKPFDQGLKQKALATPSPVHMSGEAPRAEQARPVAWSTPGRAQQDEQVLSVQPKEVPVRHGNMPQDPAALPAAQRERAARTPAQQALTQAASRQPMQQSDSPQVTGRLVSHTVQQQHDSPVVPTNANGSKTVSARETTSGHLASKDVPTQPSAEQPQSTFTKSEGASRLSTGPEIHRPMGLTESATKATSGSVDVKTLSTLGKGHENRQGIDGRVDAPRIAPATTSEKSSLRAGVQTVVPMSGQAKSRFSRHHLSRGFMEAREQDEQASDKISASDSRMSASAEAAPASTQARMPDGFEASNHPQAKRLVRAVRKRLEATFDAIQGQNHQSEQATSPRSAQAVMQSAQLPTVLPVLARQWLEKLQTGGLTPEQKRQERLVLEIQDPAHGNMRLTLKAEEGRLTVQIQGIEQSLKTWLDDNREKLDQSLKQTGYHQVDYQFDQDRQQQQKRSHLNDGEAELPPEPRLSVA